MDIKHTCMTLPAYAAHFWINALRVESGCWEWQGSRHRQGYGEFAKHPGVGERKAHRIAWALIHGPIPEGFVVRHDCDNPPCVNPGHLIPGSQGDNMQDMRNRGRAYAGKGEAANAAKLSDEDVAEMFRRRSIGETYAAIGARFGVTKTRAWQILAKEGWAFSA